MKPSIDQFCIPATGSLLRAIACMDMNNKGFVLAVDEKKRFLDTVTDSDLRRAVLTALDMEMSVGEFLADRKIFDHRKPITASLGADKSTLVRLMQTHSARQIPLLNADKCVVDIAFRNDLLPGTEHALQAVIMAGGYGTRLGPLTVDMPKPMLPIGNQPLLERLIVQLRRSGIRRIHVSTHCNPEKITDHFGDGSSFGVELRYVSEDTPLGTAGALGLIKETQDPFLVVNGDILTDLDFRAMAVYHQDHGADLTVAVRQHGVRVPYGVIENDGVAVINIVEKPSMNFLINAGIYLLSPSATCIVRAGMRLDMPDVIQLLLEENKKVVSFPIREYWIDIGHPADYEQAKQDISGSIKLQDDGG